MTSREAPWRDVALVVAITGLSVVVSAHFEMNEALYALTRRAEYLQLDELPVGMLVLMLGLIWLSLKRHRHAQSELKARRLAEAALAKVLEENRRLSQEALRVQEIERKHLARELHDEFGQYLNAIKLDAVAIQDSGDTDTRFTVNAAGAIIRAVDHIHRAVTHMIGRLRPVALDELGLVAAIEHCVDHWRERSPTTQFQLSVSGTWDDIGESLSLTAYRLIQECLTNIHKHAQATHVTIAMAQHQAACDSSKELKIVIADDGAGMQPQTATSGFGLSGMRERLEMVGGTLAVHSAPGRGVRIEASLPAQAQVA